MSTYTCYIYIYIYIYINTSYKHTVYLPVHAHVSELLWNHVVISTPSAVLPSAFQHRRTIGLRELWGEPWKTAWKTNGVFWTFQHTPGTYPGPLLPPALWSQKSCWYLDFWYLGYVLGVFAWNFPNQWAKSPSYNPPRSWTCQSW